MVGSRDLAADDQMKLHFVTTSFFFGPHTQYGWTNCGTLSFYVSIRLTHNIPLIHTLFTFAKNVIFVTEFVFLDQNPHFYKVNQWV